MYDCGVVDKELTCQCCVVFLLHVRFDGSVLSVHCEAPRKFSPCEANIAVLPKPAIFGWAIKFIQHVGSHETLGLCGLVTHNQVFRIRALTIDVHLQFVSFVLALYIFSSRYVSVFFRLSCT